MRGARVCLFVAAVVCALGFLLLGGAWAQSPKPEISNYTHQPFANPVSLSPDGDVIAYVQYPDDPDSGHLAFFSMTRGLLSRTPMANAKLRDLRWVSDDRLILTISTTAEYGRSGEEFEFSRVMSIDMNATDPVWLFSKEKKFNAVISAPQFIHPLPHDPDNILMSQYDPYATGANIGTNVKGTAFGDEWHLNLYEVNIKTGRVRTVEKGNKYTTDWNAGPSGNSLVRIDYKDAYDKEEVHYRAPGESHFQLIDTYESIDAFMGEYNIIGFGETAAEGYAIAVGEKNLTKVHSYDFTTGTLGPIVWSNPDYEYSYALLDDFSNSVLAVEHVDDMYQQTFFDSGLGALHKALKGALGAYQSVTIESTSRDRSKILLRASAAGSPSKVFHFDKSTGQLTEVMSDYPHIQPAELGTVTRFDYVSSDGVKIPGYLHKPRGKEASNLPLVVLPHGGPATRDDMHFDWEAQYYASLGYAVYQPNFRGSDGYGAKFQNDGHGEWGGLMQDDVTQGVRKLIADGIADPDRICIVGGSYGGYAALAGGAMTPDLYKCVVSYAGISGLNEFFAWRDGRGGRISEVAQYWRLSIGNPHANRAKLRDRSPINLTDNFTAPVLLIHGRNDTIVPIEQSRDMETALKRSGKTVTFVELDGEDHWLSTASTRTQYLTETSRFLETHLGR
ncbi:alpha/beta hydrolase family protein [Hyphococcus sp. DH-69]|uniref:alpha/beta hydrolase family protein n=1 Tax=Hyphococcus formosus TaxID=3143534 RepID=UPI00398AECC1